LSIRSKWLEKEILKKLKSIKRILNRLKEELNGKDLAQIFSAAWFSSHSLLQCLVSLDTLLALVTQ